MFIMMTIFNVFHPGKIISKQLNEAGGYDLEEQYMGRSKH
jgi:hypothetical protein